ncbi:MAG: hypothetical protein WAP03_21845 [Methylorubrum rhodinum]|uniref:hypothetical protein n=1 Tax=Methylorubrum rhodinum TaxID=29428 RepID=UPI003BAEA7A0
MSACNCLVCAIVATIHRHAEAQHEADPGSVEPTINVAEAISALAQVEASLVLQADTAHLRLALTDFRSQAFEAALRSAETGQPQDVSFVAPRACH